MPICDVSVSSLNYYNGSDHASTLPVVAGPLDRVLTVRTQLTMCRGNLGTVAMFDRMLKVSAMMILSKPCLNDLAHNVQAAIFGPCSRVGLKVRVRLSMGDPVSSLH